MTETNPPEVSLTPEQTWEVDRLLEDSAGVTYGDIAAAIGYDVPTDVCRSGSRDVLEDYLLKLIADGTARRVWNREAEDHFYMAILH
jgi:hypothetical protein